MTFTAANTNTARFAWNAPAIVEAAPLPLWQVVEAALDRSAEAAFQSLDSLGGDRGDCGGAWVVIKTVKGRKALMSALTARNIPHKVDGGLNIYLLRNLPCQSRLPREKGCHAFLDIIEAAGFTGHVHSYAD